MKRQVNNFKKRFVEFEDTDVSLVEAVIKESQIEMNPKFWGKELFEMASHYLAAHKLSISPMGESARLDGVQEKNIYQIEYERLCRSSFVGARLL